MIKSYRHCAVAAGTWRAGEGCRVIVGFSSVLSCVCHAAFEYVPPVGKFSMITGVKKAEETVKPNLLMGWG